ncbi:ATP-binding protein [Leucobacter sp. W1478]|uniref:ATP-binding protein n=1 Tax=Leucobacter sp. W1478 TaxID=3439065 RepID=UPI003F33A763
MTNGSIAPGQWRLAEVQLANWGTFHDAIYRIPVARRGHLITGPSGSGKSSLLDGIAAVLTPDAWLRFNLAAQGTGARSDQRGLMSYVRGAWTRRTDEFEDRVTSEYLRPGPTWSGILLRYENDVDAPVTLARLFHVSGTKTAAADLKSLYVLERSPVDLRDLEPFARGGLETRKLQAALPDSLVAAGGKTARFYQRMRSLFGIPDESALQLLHKTQSAKNLDSLNQLFRESMLERPETFALAETAREQFGELNDAHDHVVRLRQQRDHLAGLRDAALTYDRAAEQAARAELLGTHVMAYEHRRRLELAQAELERLSEELILLRSEAEDAQRASAASDDAYDTAYRRAMRLGGSDAEQLRLRIESASQQVTATRQRRERMAESLRSLGIEHAPSDAAQFAELITAAQRDRDQRGEPAGASIELHDQLSAVRREVGRLDTEIRALASSRSTMGAALVDVREALARHLGVAPSALPFAAELIEVSADHADWVGAIERVLRPLSTTLLVRSEHLAQARRWADEHRLGTRLTYEEVPSRVADPAPAVSPLSLLHRISVGEGPFTAWLQRTLSERYDYACVDAPDALDDYPRAVTIHGQVKSGRGRYMKDDRTAIDDRSTWVLGDREAKHEALIALLRAAEAERARLESRVRSATEARDLAIRRHQALGELQQQSWSEFDVVAAEAEVERLRAELAALTSADSELADAQRRLVDAKEARELARDRAATAGTRVTTAEQRQEELTAQATQLRERLASGELPEADSALDEQLAARFAAIRRSITLDTLAGVAHQVTQSLYQEQTAARKQADSAGEDITRIATQFRERWRGTASDFVASVEGRHGFIELYDAIVANGLPEHEARFFELLRERSQDMIAQLVDEILHAPAEIAARIDAVNTSLGRAPFDDGRFLSLEVKTRRSQSATDFLRDLRTISENTWSTETDAHDAERKFATLAAIMLRLESSDSVDRKWREQCLDTRLHVTFLAHEVDAHGRVHSTYDSGAAMSGGQQQKLVVFCLAAALSYQLAQPDDPAPGYGTIVLDEAFDKADTRYTRLALDVFQEFGFQMVLATPHKLLQTIEPYVGGATEIENPTRARSQVSNLVWEGREPAAAAAADAAETAE